MSSEQSVDSYKYAEGLLFNAWNMNPDTTILDFVKNYVPNLASKPEKWILKNIPTNQTRQIPTVHASGFKKHPLFKGNYADGEIQFLTLEANNKVNGIRDINLILNYFSKDSAEQDFNTLLNRFDIPEFKKIVDTNSLATKVTYTPLLDTSKPDLQFIFYKDPIVNNRYQILFRIRPSGIDETQESEFMNFH